jgi:small nuclear ribonucleoprotein G
VSLQIGWKSEHTLTRAEYMDRRLFLHIQGGRKVSGVLRGFDLFLNLVIDQAHEELGGGERRACGMVVSLTKYQP